MKCSQKGDGLVSPAVPPGQFESGFDRFRSGVGQKHPLFKTARRDGCQAFCKLNHGQVIKIRTAYMNEISDLSLSSSDHFWVAVAGITDGDPRSKIQVFISVNILDPLSPAFYRNQWIFSGKGWR